MVGVRSGVKPVLAKSVAHPVVMLVTTAARVALLQGGAPQTAVNQLLIGATMDLLLPPEIIGASEEGLRHAAASGLRATDSNADTHAEDILNNGSLGDSVASGVDLRLSRNVSRQGDNSESTKNEHDCGGKMEKKNRTRWRVV